MGRKAAEPRPALGSDTKSLPGGWVAGDKVLPLSFNRGLAVEGKGGAQDTDHLGQALGPPELGEVL